MYNEYKQECDGNCYGCNFTECDGYIQNTGEFVITIWNREADTGAFIECGFRMNCNHPFNKELETFKAYGTYPYLRLNEYAKQKDYTQLYKSLKYLIDKDYDKYDNDSADAQELDYALDIIKNAADRKAVA